MAGKRKTETPQNPLSNTVKEKDGKIRKVERIAVKIIDAKEIESLKIIRM